eukprot:UN15007
MLPTRYVQFLWLDVFFQHHSSRKCCFSPSISGLKAQ